MKRRKSRFRRSCRKASEFALHTSRDDLVILERAFDERELAFSGRNYGRDIT
jgi:hypothetical protein